MICDMNWKPQDDDAETGALAVVSFPLRGAEYAVCGEKRGCYEKGRTT